MNVRPRIGGTVYLSSSKFLDPFLAKVRPKLTSSIQGQLNPGGALFLSRGLSLDDFHKLLREREIASVLLPPFFNQADAEFLIADDDLDRVGDLVTKWPDGPSIKLYSVTGGRREHRFEPPDLRAKANYAVSLFPPRLAQALIAGAAPDERGVRVLGARERFLACAYRAAYLQRECWDGGRSDSTASAECDSGLRRLAADVDMVLDAKITPRKLDDLLSDCGWRPSLDLLERAAHWMPWIRDILPDREEEAAGLSVFFLRSAAVEAGWGPKIVDSLRLNGFEPLLILDLDDEQARIAAAEFRGGNWGRGPYRVSGGPPASICVALDLLPLAVQDRDKAQFPDCDNSRIFDVKYAARDLVNAGAAKRDHYNPLHSTDNSSQAWRAVRLLLPGREGELRGEADRLQREFAGTGAIRDLSKHGRRAKVELVDFHGTLAIRKTFRPSALQFMQREIDVMARLAPLCREIPRLLERGHNHIVMEYVGGGAVPPSKRRSDAPPRPLPLRHVRRLAELISISMANGFDPIDLRADGNVIYTRSGLHLIDFEFWRPCEPGPAEKSMCLSGIPADDTGDQPRAGQRNRTPYRVGWYPYTLLTLESFLHDPAPLQRLKRSVNFVREYCVWLWRSFSFHAKRAVKGFARKGMSAAVRLIGPRASRLLTQ